MENDIERVDIQIDLRKPYIKPEIIHEFDIETRAGSPFPTQQIIDPFGNDNQ